MTRFIYSVSDLRSFSRFVGGYVVVTAEVIGLRVVFLSKLVWFRSFVIHNAGSVVVKGCVDFYILRFTLFR